ncbi:MAG: TIGR00282 family metallophosphoesterase [Planctomycetota bacterium]|jgi:metallophosphoesterase (TIGR00282 family)
MRVLCLGDVVGAPGLSLLKARLRAFREENSIDFCVVNAENSVEGSGLNRAAFKVIRDAGADVCTTGDHVFKRADVLKLFKLHPDEVLRPINYPVAAAGRGFCRHEVNGVSIGVINAQGRVFMDPCDDPFKAISGAIANMGAKIVIVDFHAEATSEKRAMGFFLDGKVSAVVGTHTHVPTADEEILPNGTAYVSDLGMTGGFRSVIGRQAKAVVYSMTTRMYSPFGVSDEDVRSTGVIVDIDNATGRATMIERVTIRMDE